MKQIVIAVSLVLALAAPAMAEQFPNPFQFACKHCR